VKEWLNQLTTWRFALIVAGFDLTLLLIALGIAGLTTTSVARWLLRNRGHWDLNAHPERLRHVLFCQRMY
jgi:hypothetical protein